MNKRCSLFMLWLVAAAYGYAWGNAYAATRLGFHTTAEEVELWKQRMAHGPYKTTGDVSPNSPGDWTRILANANAFVADPAQHRWAGQPTATCWSPRVPPNQSPPKPASRSHGEKLRDAGFVFLLTGTEKYRDAVLQELLAQAAEPGTQWTPPRWCTSPKIASGHSWEIAMWLTKLIYGYDYIRSSISSGNRATLDAWFLAAGTYWERISREEPQERFPQRSSGNYDDMGPGWSMNSTTNTHCRYGPCITHFGAHTKVNFHEAWNNRNAQQLRIGFLAGILTNDTALISAGKQYVQEWLRYGVFADNTPAEMNRWEAGKPCLGWWYTGFHIGTMLTIADVLARYNGDTSLYDMVTSEGIGTITPAGGPKSILAVMTLYQRFTDGTITRYGTNKAAEDGDPNYRIRANCPSYGFHGVADTFLAVGNIYYQNRYIASVYQRKASGAPAYPSSPFTGGYGAWGGEWGTYPGVLFMFGQMEGQVNPYVQGSPPDIRSNLEMHLQFDEGIGSTVQNAAGNAHAGTLGTGATWRAAKLGTSAVQLDGTTQGIVTVPGLLGTPASVTLAAWIKPAAFPTPDADILTIGDYVILRVSATYVRGSSYNGSGWTPALFPVVLDTTAWQHVAYTVEPGAQRLYLNGVQVASSDNTSAIRYADLGSHTILGGHGFGAETFRFQGSVDDVRVYSRVLTPTDIAALAASTEAVPHGGHAGRHGGR